MNKESINHLPGKVALITGGGSGMGQTMAVRLARSGVKVAALDLNAAGLEKTASLAAEISTYVCDVTDADAVAQVVKMVEQELGPIHRLAIAAGIMPAQSVADMPLSAFAKVMRINYEGTVNTVKAALPAMQQRNQGEIVIFGSLAGVIYAKNFSAYNASKAAVNAFAEVLAHELADTNIRVVNVRPAAVATPLIQQATGEGGLAGLRKQEKSGRMATPDQIIDAIEAGLVKGRYIVYPTAEAKIGALLRRFAPELVWKIANASDKG